MISCESLLLIGCLVTAVPPGNPEEREATLRTALRAWETSAANLRSYDVLVRIERTHLLKAVEVGDEGEKHRKAPVYDVRKLSPGEAPRTNIEFSRQVLSKDGKRRYELFPTRGASWTEARVFDGEIVRQRAPQLGSAAIFPDGPEKDAFVLYERSYAALYHDLPYGGSLIPLLRARKSTRLKAGEGNEQDRVVIESPPEQGNYREFGWRVVLDPHHGMMPVRIGLFRKSMESLYCDVTIRRFHEVSSGTWAPMEAVHSYLLNGQTATEVKLTVQMESSSWNLPVSDDVFALPFPVGTRVMDKTRDLAYITGKADAGKNVDTLLEGAHKVIGRKPVPPPELPTGWKRWRFPVLITANAVAATVFLALLWVRKRNRREATKG